MENKFDIPENKNLNKYLPEFVYGGIDGSITTFAVVAGAAGAGLSGNIVIILGFANLFADGFSMSVGAFLSAKSSKELYHKHERNEYWEIENIPHTEVEEIREIYRNKGFEGQLLEDVVKKITEDKDRWVDTMMKEELEMIPDSKSPFKIGLATFISFFSVGIIPLLIFVADFFLDVEINLFTIASVLTFFAFIGIGYLKSMVTQTSKIKSVTQTLLLGIIAAILAYFVGAFLEQILGK
ncbi:MAG: VIT1/CCC1 transporter family protein [Chitinophagales bacterium]|nr:VIT1/CCC1 transporter family protein [Bacteroidota bacterium]MBP7398342.1 VIT1/CCC1 transporter family protein [Chitinophagales bacterium]MBP8753087.1 VIT1/CCC1 transporter family protein [Chitinophagales bacterium]MBP9188115.1 VIT1/CCC1 transporter family protein [Chitinophagales bacterium]MBP9547513.1 VIT1/CCC1 transporter family protein [Chitinophagales bacterium]